MKKKSKNQNREIAGIPSSNLEPTAFDLVMNFKNELYVASGLEPLPFWKRSEKMPQWTKNICVKLRNTILKSVLKLKPQGNKINWRNYGRSIGCLERYKTFILKDIPRIWEKEGLDRITEEQWRKIEPRLGLEKARQYYLKVLNRPEDDPTSSEDLVIEMLERQLEHHEKLKQTAFFHVAGQDAKTTSIFLKGFSEGYGIFLNEEGDFSGDGRLADVYLELASCQYEIEKMRRTLPAKSRNDLRADLKKSPDFQDRGQKWFNHVCDEIQLSMKSVGRTHKFAVP